MKKKLLVTLLSAVTAICGAFALSACSGTDKKQAVINENVAFALATDYGYNGTAEDFTSALAGSGAQIAKVELTPDGEVIVKLTDGTVINLGKAEIQQPDIPACDKNGHGYSEWTVAETPTCVSLGYNVRTCAVCGDTDYQIIPALGHKVINGYSQAQSSHSFICETCGYNVQEHTFANGECTVCGYEPDYTVGLEYIYIAETNSYAVSGYGDVTDENVVIPDTYKSLPVTGIASYAFYGNRTLKSVVVPESVTKIGNDAFQYCENLTDIDLPDGITEIGRSSFVHCSALKSVKLPANLTAINASTFMRSGLEYVTVPDKVTIIGSGAFAYCKQLKEINIPYGVTEMGNGAFMRCESLTEIIIPDSVTKYGVSPFASCSALKSVKLSENATVLTSGMFKDCTSLESIVIPDCVTDIYGAFIGCTALKTVKTSENLTSISASAFSGCTSLEEIVIPEGVTKIKSNTFRNCESLTDIVIPESVTFIGSGALVGCDALCVITFNGTCAQWKAVEKESGWRTVDNIITNLSVICSDGTLEYIW